MSGPHVHPYRDFLISYDPAPGARSLVDWVAVHKDFDGAPDAYDDRHYRGCTMGDCREWIDAYWESQGVTDPEVEAERAYQAAEAAGIARHNRLWSRPDEAFRLPLNHR